MPEEEKDVQTQTGSESQTSHEIDWSSVKPDAIPFEVLRNHPEYEKQRQEAIQNRQKYADLQAQLEPKDPDPTQASDESDSDLSQVLNVVQQLAQRLDGIENKGAAQTRKDYITRKLKASKLPEDKLNKAVGFIDQAGASQEVLDQRINDYLETGNWNVQSGSVDPANVDENDTTTSNIMSRVNMIIGGKDTGSIFDVAEQKRAKGGAVLRKN